MQEKFPGKNLVQESKLKVEAKSMWKVLQGFGHKQGPAGGHGSDA